MQVPFSIFDELHSNLTNIMLVETKGRVILRRYVVLTWMRVNKELV